MISVLDHIEYLSSRHDCVIVPGLGAFISHYSYIKNSDGMLLSLERNISFNMSVNTNDGLLINSIMRRESVSFDNAKSIIDDYVVSLRNQLKHEGEVPVGRLGYMKDNSDGNLEFFPFVSQKTCNEYFGLNELTLKPLSIKINEEDIESTGSKTKIIPLTKKFMQAAASIILLIGMTLVLSTPIIEDENQNYANINAFSLKNHTEKELKELYISIPKAEEHVEATTNVTIEETAEIENSTISENGNYCIVIASLASKSQAEKYIKENGLSDTECKITKSTVKYRVYVARGTFDEMVKLKESKYSDSDAWVCKI